MVTKHLSSTYTDDPCVAATAQHLHEAECALHDAHQSHVEQWIAAASDRLHIALIEYLTAEAAARHAEGNEHTL